MRAYVFFGVVLLICSIVGAKLAFDQSASSQTKSTNGVDPNRPPDRIFAWGNFDVEPGVAQLYPKQFGDVALLAAENTTVEEGQVLLQIDDKIARLQLEQAKADVKAGELQLAEAKQLTESYKLEQAQQQAAVRAIEHERKRLEYERDTKISSLDDSQAIKKTTIALYKEALGQLIEKKNAEEAKLKQIGLQNAQWKIDQAQASLDAKVARSKQAEELLKHHQVLAPSKGTVLRVHVRKGETLGPNPRVHAIDFLPASEPIIVRAEVLQEWGRFVKVGQEVEIEDDTHNGAKWQGKIKSLSQWYAHTRTPIIEPFRYNDVRTLECIIEIKDGGPAKRIGQRVRVTVNIH